jgi:hypothetical protein
MVRSQSKNGDLKNDIPDYAKKGAFSSSQDALSTSEYYHVDDLLSQHIWEVLKGRKSVMKKRNQLMEWDP